MTPSLSEDVPSYHFTSVYSDGTRVREGLQKTTDPEAVVERLLAFRGDQTEAPIRVEYRVAPNRRIG